MILKGRISVTYGIAIGLIFTIILSPYFQTVHNGFINLDEFDYISTNPIVKCGLTFTSFLNAFSTCSQYHIWMPLTWISYMVDVSLWGVNPGAIHAVNMVLHAINAVLVFELLRIVFQKTYSNLYTPPPIKNRGSFICTVALSVLVWAMHPLRVEPVAWLASRKDLLFLFWELLALLFWIRGIERAGEKVPVNGLSTFRVFSFICFLLACMSKPAAVTFPFLAAILEYLITQRVRWQLLARYGIAALFCGVLAIYLQNIGDANVLLHNVPFSARLTNAISAVGQYIWTTIWPRYLAVPYVHRWPAAPVFLWQGVLICGALGVAGIWSGRRTIKFFWHWLLNRFHVRRDFPISDSLDFDPPWRRAVFVGLAWFIIAITPMLGIFSFGYHSHADRFTYLPSIGFSIIVVFFVEAVFQHSRSAGRMAQGLLILLVVAFGWRSWVQTSFWKNDETLFTHTLDIDGSDNFIANRNLGIFFFCEKHDLKKAKYYLERALTINVEQNRNIQLLYIFTLAESDALQHAKDQTQEFSRWLEQLTMKDDRPISLENTEPQRAEWSLDLLLAYAMISLQEGDVELAKQHIQAVLAMASPNGSTHYSNGCAHYLLGKLALKEHRTKEAIEQWMVCLNNDDRRFFHFLKPKIAELTANQH